MIYDNLPQKDKDLLQQAWDALDKAYKQLWEQEKLDKESQSSE